MNGIQGIRNINAEAAKAKVTSERFQAQYKGDGWCVFDSHTSGWGASYATARDCQQACDALNVG